jgi:hypothetical protein
MTLQKYFFEALRSNPALKQSFHVKPVWQLSSKCRNYATTTSSNEALASKGPTAVVFLNMGGPSTTDEVGDFLSRLFVSNPQSFRRSLTGE